MIAAVTLIYAAARVGQKISEGWFLWDQRRSGPSFVVCGLPGAITLLTQIAVGLLVILGAIQLLRNRSQRLLLIGQWAMVVLWLLVFFAGWIIQRQGPTLSYLFDSVFDTFYSNVFPIMVILILRVHRLRQQMEPQLQIATDAPQQVVGPWPRLLKIISIMMLLFSLMQVVGVGRYINRLMRLPESPNSSDDTDTRTIVESIGIGIIVVTGVVDVFVAGGALRLYRRREARLLIIGLWLWLLVWAAGVLQYIFEYWPVNNVIASMQLLNRAEFATFPALVLLILREYAGHSGLPRNPLRLFVRWLID